MTVIEPRVVQVAVGPPGAEGRLWDQSLYISGTVERTSGSTPNKAKIQIYNLAPASLAYLEKPGHVMQVRVGETVPTSIFYGELRASGIKTALKHPDLVTSLEATDGRSIMQSGWFTGSYPANTTRSQILTDVLAQNGIARGYVAPLAERTYQAPTMWADRVDAVLDELYLGELAEWSLQGGRFYLLLDDTPAPGNAPVISAKTGMIGSPERTDKGVKVDFGQVGAVVPCGPFSLVSRLVSGSYKAIKITTEFDTELKWQDKITGRPI